MKRFLLPAIVAVLAVAIPASAQARSCGPDRTTPDGPTKVEAYGRGNVLLCQSHLFALLRSHRCAASSEGSGDATDVSRPAERFGMDDVVLRRSPHWARLGGNHHPIRPGFAATFLAAAAIVAAAFVVPAAVIVPDVRPQLSGRVSRPKCLPTTTAWVAAATGRDTPVASSLWATTTTGSTQTGTASAASRRGLTDSPALAGANTCSYARAMLYLRRRDEGPAVAWWADVDARWPAR